MEIEYYMKDFVICFKIKSYGGYAMFQEINNDELYDLNAGGGLFSEIGYAVGRLFAVVTQAVVEAKYHPSYPCGGDCCSKRYYN